MFNWKYFGWKWRFIKVFNFYIDTVKLFVSKTWTYNFRMQIKAFLYWVYFSSVRKNDTSNLQLVPIVFAKFHWTLNVICHDFWHLCHRSNRRQSKQLKSTFICVLIALLFLMISWKVLSLKYFYKSTYIMLLLNALNFPLTLKLNYILLYLHM